MTTHSGEVINFLTFVSAGLFVRWGTGLVSWRQRFEAIHGTLVVVICKFGIDSWWHDDKQCRKNRYVGSFSLERLLSMIRCRHQPKKFKEDRNSIPKQSELEWNHHHRVTRLQLNLCTRIHEGSDVHNRTREESGYLFSSNDVCSFVI